MEHFLYLRYCGNSRNEEVILFFLKCPDSLCTFLLKIELGWGEMVEMSAWRVKNTHICDFLSLEK